MLTGITRTSTRTSDPGVVNNWTFYMDGSAVWSTRHEGVPTAHAAATLLLGPPRGAVAAGQR